MYYHATRAVLEPGSLIEPGHPPNFADEPSGLVFFTDNLEAAEFWEEFLGGESMAEKLGYWPTIYRYEVMPEGPYERDDHQVNSELDGVWLSEAPLRVIRQLAVFPGE
jgi:rifampin ADP-ribosylating transferase